MTIKYDVEFRERTCKHIKESGKWATSVGEELGIDKINRQGNIVTRKVYDFGDTRFIRDDVIGHVFGDGESLGRHVNTILGHYFY